MRNEIEVEDLKVKVLGFEFIGTLSATGNTFVRTISGNFYRGRGSQKVNQRPVRGTIDVTNPPVSIKSVLIGWLAEVLEENIYGKENDA